MIIDIKKKLELEISDKIFSIIGLKLPLLLKIYMHIDFVIAVFGQFKVGSLKATSLKPKSAQYNSRISFNLKKKVKSKYKF